MKPTLTCIEKAWLKRKEFVRELEQEGTNAYRLFGGAPEGIDGFFVDRFGAVIFLITYPDKCSLTNLELQEVGKWYLALDGVCSIYAKPFVSDRSHTVAGTELYSEKPLSGERAKTEFCIFEKRRQFLIRPFSGFSVGLFLDQRENRQVMAEGIQGRRVLNGFAYTCGFSVACAMSGAEVTSVDLSKKYLEWGKKNFEFNGISVESHRFIAGDVFDTLHRAKKRGEKWDRIILDPPSFSRNRKGKTFSVHKNLDELLTLAHSALLPEGEIFFSTNYSSLDESALKRAVITSLGPVHFQQLPKLPLDFRVGVTPHAAITFRFN